MSNGAAGLQVGLVRLEGPIVAMRAHAHSLALVWHSSAPQDKRQSLHAAIWDVAEQTQVHPQPSTDISVSYCLPCSAGDDITCTAGTLCMMYLQKAVMCVLAAAVKPMVRRQNLGCEH